MDENYQIRVTALQWAQIFNGEDGLSTEELIDIADKFETYIRLGKARPKPTLSVVQGELPLA